MEASTKEKISSGVTIVIGFLILAKLIEHFVYHQYYLIAEKAIFYGVIIIGVIVTFIFSALETALVSSVDKDEEKCTELIDGYSEKIKEIRDKQEKTPEDERQKKEFSKELKKIGVVAHILEVRDEKIPSLVIGSNTSALFIGAILSISFIKSPQEIHEIGIVFKNLSIWLGLDKPIAISVPGEGLEMLNFCSAGLAIIIFGKTIPKSIGRDYRLRLIKSFSWLINFLSFFLGFVSASIYFIKVCFEKITEVLFGKPEKGFE